MADGRGVGLPLAPGQLSHLHGEVADGGGPVAARDPLESEAACGHFGLWHQELSGGRRPLCNRERTERGHERLLLPEGPRRARTERAEEREWTPGPWPTRTRPSGS